MAESMTDKYLNNLKEITNRHFNIAVGVVVILALMVIVLLIMMYMGKEPLNGPSTTMNYQQLEHLAGPSATMNYQQLEHLAASPAHNQHTGNVPAGNVPAGVLHPNQYQACELNDVVSPTDPFYYLYTDQVSQADTEGFQNVNEAELTRIMAGG